mgnify:CR=1 FL=1
MPFGQEGIGYSGCSSFSCSSNMQIDASVVISFGEPENLEKP